ncbi:hypothetical protein [uncultured Anaerovibrio sp.]|uniref:hypothetical protein n=1 Tax=uncultured Anaerovibrio sp. TaxID=361586 RepID=UPI002626A4AB|nr:hypothetical protein [uncultured Anaerovibrio sp.]
MMFACNIDSFLENELVKIRDYFYKMMANFPNASFKKMLEERKEWLPPVYISDEVIVIPKANGPFDKQLGKSLKKGYSVFIYHKAVKEYCRTFHLDNEYECVLSMVLAHEFFHSLHRIWDERAFLQDASPRTGISMERKHQLTESLADYFAFSWLESNADGDYAKVAQHRKSLWQEYTFANWPYSAALVFVNNPNKFFEILELLKLKPAMANSSFYYRSSENS